MENLKEQILSAIEDFLDDRLAGRLSKPKAVAVDVIAEKKPEEGHPDDAVLMGKEGSREEEAAETPVEEAKEGGPDEMSPEDRDELEKLYSKMGR